MSTSKIETKVDIITERIGLTKKEAIPVIFGKSNFIFMIAGLGLIAIGVMLMAGGKSDPAKFNPEEVYSKTRIVVAPLLITIGLLLEVYAIMRNNKN